MRPARRLAACLALTLPFLVSADVAAPPAAAPGADAASVSGFSPQGTVKGVRQVKARFSEAMVPLGDPRGGPEPFEIRCAAKGSGRWVDSASWVFDFTRDLPAGIRCDFALRAGLRTLEDESVSGQRVFSFSTGGPAIRESRPWEGSVIEEGQVFLLGLDAPPDEGSVLSHVSFAVKGLPEPIGARIVRGAERAAILKGLPRWERPDEPVLALRAARPFPEGSKVSLVWGKGVATKTGVATDRDQTIPFQVRPAFTAEFRCERENKRAKCIPVTPMELRFSAPVAWRSAREITLTGPDGKRRGPKPPGEPSPYVDAVEFPGPFPESAKFRLELPPDLTDDAGRALGNADRFPLDVRTDPYPPLAKFQSRFAIVESKADPALPVTLRNLEPRLRTALLPVGPPPPPGKSKGLGWLGCRLARVAPERMEDMIPWLQKVSAATREKSVFPAGDPSIRPKSLSLPKPLGAKAFEVVGIPLAEPGLYVVEIESARLGASLLGKPRPLYVPAAALVTNLAVHFKWGREGSLAWVTSLDRGRPVGAAQVSVHDCAGKTLWSGASDSNGVARIPKLPDRNSIPRCGDAEFRSESGIDWVDHGQTPALQSLSTGLYVAARKDGDASFVHSSWEDGIEPWRFNLPSESWQDPIVAHTILDRSLLRAGDTVHLKHLLRAQITRGFAAVPSAERPTRLKIVHGGSGEEFEMPLRWDASGVAENEWAIPKGARLGVYSVVLERKPRPAPKAPGGEAPEGPRDYGRTWISGQFRVEEFRVPLMRGTLRLPAEPQIGATSVPADVAVQYLAGGSAARLPAILRAQIAPAAASFEAFEDFTFGSAELKATALRRPETGEEGPEGGAPPVHQRSEIRLDAAGTARVAVTRLPRSPRPQSLLTELEFRDPNGAAQTVSSTITLWPSRRLVGIRPDGWVASRDRVRAQVVVVDVTGKPVAGAPVTVHVFENRTYSIRKRLVGGFYGYDHVEETKPRGRLCAGVTGPRGIFFCEGKPGAEGSLSLQASAPDDAGRMSYASSEVWVAGSEDWWFRAQDNDRIDLLPEKKKYEPGEKARLQVRMPFRKATALVTTEREGVIDARVVALSGKEPVIEVPLRANDAPNVFVSALVVRGRVGGVQPTAMVDLGRPAFKLGVAELRVGWSAHALKVEVSSPRAVYQVREKATVRVRVRGSGGAPPPPGSEVAIAAVDEGLLDLSPNPSWDLLDAMMGRRAYDVRTSTAQMQVIGKRHYGRKALPHGGGGGRQSTRELFDTILLWKGRLPLDANGEATVEIPLNDSLTSFRIVAVASAGLDRFGTGALSIRATQDLMLLSGIPPFVREGDRFSAEFTLRNTTARPIAVDVTAKAEGLGAPLAPQRLAIAAGESAVAAWEVAAPAGVDRMSYEAQASSGPLSDRLKVVQRVGPAVPVQSLQATILLLEKPASQSVERPAGALPDRGGVRVGFQASLADGMDGVEDWMRAYPYTCLEQEVSRAVALGDRARWDALMATLPTYGDADGLLRYFPSITLGSEVLTTYVMQIADEAGWPVPDAVLAGMQRGLTAFVNGTITRTPSVRVADLSIRKVAALEALARHGKADPKLLASVVIEPNLWPTSAVIDWWSLLRRVPSIPDRAARMREAEQIVRSRLDLEGTVMKFSTEDRDGLWWLMVSPDVNAQRLLLLLVDGNLWKTDLPRVLRGALGRQRNGAWDLTVANAWGTLAVKKFAAAYEKAPVTGASEAALAEARQRLDWSRWPKGETFDLPWPAERADVTLTHAGTGRPWVTIASRAAVPLRAPVSSGYRVNRTLVPVERKQGWRWTRGDIVRVRLDVDAQSDMTWVVVSDPVPGGASHLGTGLARESQITLGESGGPGSARPDEPTAWPAFEERSFEAFRAYFEYLPKGHQRVEYVIRLNQDGLFQMPPTRVEAMYAPEMFGEAPNAPWEIGP